MIVGGGGGLGGLGGGLGGGKGGSGGLGGVLGGGNVVAKVPVRVHSGIFIAILKSTASATKRNIL